MKLKTILLYVTFIALIAVVILMFMPYPGQEELMNQEQAPVETQQNFNPQYGDLTDEQIAIADRAIGDLLNSVEGINPSMVTVSNFQAEQYPDASLGCPQEGTSYAQVETPGYQVMLEAAGKTYDYRLDTKEAVVMCQK